MIAKFIKRSLKAISLGCLVVVLASGLIVLVWIALVMILQV